MFVFFYSATCPACRRFDPIWEATSCEYQGTKVVFAHLEGNANQGVIQTYQVSHTPTLALFNRVSLLLGDNAKDMATPIKFNGQQYKESLLYFVRVLSPYSIHLQSQSGEENPGSPAVHITEENDAFKVRSSFPLLSSSPSGEAMSTITLIPLSTDSSPRLFSRGSCHL